MSESAYPGIVPEHRPNGSRTHCVKDGEPWPCGNGPFGSKSSVSAWQRIAVLESELQNAFMIISALVVKYGEDSAQGDRVARLTDAELVDVRREKPTVYRVDDPGEIVFRVRP